MTRRLQATLADYVIVAINPALIMVLIGSLIYFLLEMFYQGQYPERLHYCLTLYIFGAVLVSRVSMEEGWDHAAPLGAALALVMVLALHRFVSYTGTSLAAIGWLINYLLIALISWCAHKLTWDCTLIDESQDASGEGLLQTAKLDLHEISNADEKSAVAEGADVKSAPKSAKRVTQSDQAADVESFVSTRPASQKKKSWWQDFVERRRRPHAPGVWIVYFSLAALPLFGFGQVFIPAANTASRRYAFVLLAVYVASGLGLLLTTSFLGLRRYLRQRKLEMPAAMTGAWLATGAALIVGLLLFSALLPRPNAEYAISQMPKITSQERDSSKVFVGKEGTKNDQAESAPGKRSRPEGEQQQDPNAKANGTERAPENTKSGGTSESERSQQSGSKNSSDSPSQDGQSKGEKSSDGQANEKSSDKAGSEKGESKGSISQGSDSQSDTGSQHPDSSQGADAKSEQNAENQNQNEAQKPEAKQEEQSDATGQSPDPNAPQPDMEPPNVASLGGAIADLLKWIFYGVLIAAAVWWGWRNREFLLAWLQSLLTFWRDLLGKRQRIRPVAAAAGEFHKSFAEYADPFAAGVAGRYPPEELVRYSFEALEAWARDHGWPRDADQTAYEFARAVGSQSPQLAAPARTLAELYSRAAYAPETLPGGSVESLRPIWQAMRAPQLMAS
jgi:hypothetical protein